MQAAAKAISLDVPASVKVGACQTLSELLPETDKGVIQPQIMDLFSSLMDLLKHVMDFSKLCCMLHVLIRFKGTLHLILETLQEAVKAGHEAVITIVPIISPAMLNLWAMHIADPFRTVDIVEVLEAVKNAPQCMWPLVSRVLPSIGPVLEKPQQQPEGLVAGSLDLITMLLKGNVILCGFRNGAIVTVHVRQKQQGCPGGVSKHRIPFSSNKSHGNPSKNTSKRPKGWFELKGSIHPSSTIFMPSSISSLISLQTDDQYFLASSMDGSIKLYDHQLIQRGPIQSYEGHVNSHSRIQLGVDPAERLLMSGGEDGKVRTWSIKTGELLFGEKISNIKTGELLGAAFWVAL